MNIATTKSLITFSEQPFLNRFMAFLLLLAINISFVQADTSAPITKLNFAATDWCPYSCGQAHQPGFVTEALTQILADNAVTLTVTILPWTRAIKTTELGQFDGLLTAIPSEAPGFHLTQHPTGHYQVCLFSHPDSTFIYQGRQSINGITLGGIQDYGYGKPIDDIIANPLPGEQVHLLSSSNPLFSLIEMTHKKRIDTFIEDRFVVGYYMKNEEKRTLRNSGCLESIPFFTAFSPSYKKHKEGVALLNRLLDSAEYDLIYTQAQQRYTTNLKH